MILLLTSSPFIPNANAAYLNPANGFIHRLETILPEKPSCLYICSDPDSAETDTFAQVTAEAFEAAQMPLGSVTVLDRRNDENARELVLSSDLIVLAGGHVPTQNAYFQEIGLAQILEEYEGILMGISAGSMNCASEVYRQPEAPGESAPDFPRFAPGLGLTDTNILPHYQQVKDYTLDGLRLFEDITYADSEGHCFLAMVDGSYIYNDGGGEVLFGEAYLLQDGILEQISGEDNITVIW